MTRRGQQSGKIFSQIKPKYTPNPKLTHPPAHLQHYYLNTPATATASPITSNHCHEEQSRHQQESPVQMGILAFCHAETGVDCASSTCVSTGAMEAPRATITCPDEITRLPATQISSQHKIVLFCAHEWSAWIPTKTRFQKEICYALCCRIDCYMGTVLGHIAYPMSSWDLRFRNGGFRLRLVLVHTKSQERVLRKDQNNNNVWHKMVQGIVVLWIEDLFQ